MTSSEYLSVWVLYLGSASVFIFCLWWITSPLNRLALRLALLFSAIAILLTPVTHPEQPVFYVPVIAAAALQFIADGREAAWPHISVLLLSIVFALLLALVIDKLQPVLARRFHKG